MSRRRASASLNALGLSNESQNAPAGNLLAQFRTFAAPRFSRRNPVGIGRTDLLQTMQTSQAGSSSAQQSQSYTNTVSVSSDITTNTIWHADTLYTVSATVQVQALLVIEPGTTVDLYDNCSLRVNNGGAVIANGTPDNMIIFEPTQVNNYYYQSAIVFENSASTSSQVSYCIIALALEGVCTRNIRLDTPIRDNCFMQCVDGIREYGVQMTDIVNNKILGSAWRGIYISMRSATGEESSASTICIQNNTCYYTFDGSGYGVGILVTGASDPANAGIVQTINNVVAASYSCGIQWLHPTDPDSVSPNLYNVACHNGYWGNGYDNNLGDYGDEPGAIHIADPAQRPLETDPLDPLGMGYGYLAKDGAFCDAGCGGVDLNTGDILPGDIAQIPFLVGSTTTLDRECDVGIVDLGFHYSNFNVSNVGKNSLSADINDNGSVGQDDVGILMSHLGQTSNATRAEGDLNGDGRVDLYDLVMLRKQWGKVGYVCPSLSATINGDAGTDNLTGAAEIGFTGALADASRAFVFLDGQYLGPIGDADNISESTLLLKSQDYLNGSHKLKVIGLGTNGEMCLSEMRNVTFSNPIYGMVAENHFSPGSDYHVRGFYDGTDSLTAKVLSLDNATVWPVSPDPPQSIGMSVNITIPAMAFTDGLFYRVVISREAGGGQGGMQMAASTDNDKLFEQLISKRFDGNSRVPYHVLITLPEKGWPYWGRGTGSEVFEDIVLAIEGACRKKNLTGKTLVLYYDDCTWNNLSLVLRTRPIQYWYHAGHGASSGRNHWYSSLIYRTEIALYDTKVFSFLASDNLTGPPPFPELQQQPYLQTDQSFWSLGIPKGSTTFPGGLLVAFIDTCLSSSPNCVFGSRHDLALALGMYSKYYDTPKGQVYIGWNMSRTLKLAGQPTNDNKFVRTFWTELGNGKSVRGALDAANDAVGTEYYHPDYRFYEDPTKKIVLRGNAAREQNNGYLGNIYFKDYDVEQYP